MRELIRNFLKRFGYDIIKIDGLSISKRSKSPKTEQVWNYRICMPANNTLLRTYKVYPDFNMHLSRLAIEISQKYPNMTIVDVGANVGDTIAVLRSVINVPIIGIEGDDVSYQYLEKNIKQFRNVEIVKTFLGEKRQDIKGVFENSGWNTTIIPMEMGQKTISFKTLDEVLAEGQFKNAGIKLIKIDAEGFDTIILRGAYNIVEKHQPVIFFEYNKSIMKKIQEDGLSTILSFTNYGYNRIAFFDYIGRLVFATSLSNNLEIKSLTNYLSFKNNLFGYLDICIFHKQDDTLAGEFLLAEENYNAGKL